MMMGKVLMQLSPEAFQPVVVRGVTRVTPSSFIISITPSQGFSAFAPLPVAFSISIADKSMSLDGAFEQRPYTPLIPNSVQPGMPTPYLDILVKQYVGGQVSGFLAARQPGDTVLVRGPFIKLQDPEGMLKRFPRIGMVAGGTGIAPMLQVLRYAAATGYTGRITLLYGSLNRDEIALKDRLDALVLEFEGRMTVHYAVDGDPDGQHSGPVGLMSEAMIRECLGEGPQSDMIVLVCGPPPMMKAVGGGGRKEPLGGFLKDIGYEHVHKY